MNFQHIRNKIEYYQHMSSANFQLQQNLMTENCRHIRHINNFDNRIISLTKDGCFRICLRQELMREYAQQIRMFEGKIRVLQNLTG